MTKTGQPTKTQHELDLNAGNGWEKNICLLIASDEWNADLIQFGGFRLLLHKWTTIQ